MMTLMQYVAMLERVAYPGGPDFFRNEWEMPRVRGGRRRDGLFDVQVAYALQSIGAGLSDRAVGMPTKVPHSHTDDIKDHVAQEGWYPGAPSLLELMARDGCLFHECEDSEALQLQDEVARRLVDLKRRNIEEKRKNIRTRKKIPRINLSEIDIAKIKEYYKTESMNQISLRYRYSAGFIKTVLLKAGVPLRSRGTAVRMSQVKTSPLTPEPAC